MLELTDEVVKATCDAMTLGKVFGIAYACPDPESFHKVFRTLFDSEADYRSECARLQSLVPESHPLAGYPKNLEEK